MKFTVELPSSGPWFTPPTLSPPLRPVLTFLTLHFYGALNCSASIYARHSHFLQYFSIFYPSYFMYNITFGKSSYTKKSIHIVSPLL